MSVSRRYYSATELALVSENEDDTVRFHELVCGIFTAGCVTKYRIGPNPILP